MYCVALSSGFVQVEEVGGGVLAQLSLLDTHGQPIGVHLMDMASVSRARLSGSLYLAVTVRRMCGWNGAIGENGRIADKHKTVRLS